ncbi:MAG: tRNA (N6-isopentenyl adenosine(37)-C2)-methylthiotransferase MiaB [Candidatus Cloacimonadaceae bacterium]|nr:tRNA (N6-isopentenyl adenosine(37)-C2)-methylthiotransferase MiaB [Candidatus Cloacimonadota bacterium]MDX9949599.1 tRNA (N6-isopentenyl adenosine(37)-C2)-methylthiotransferase MiaB [Candidatus Syntrophosphaera sp.]
MKFFIETYGCQMNVSDSELISGILQNAGWEAVSAIDDADLILFNTCSVRQHAEERVLGRISNEKHRKQQNPQLKIAVLGCMAQRVGKRLLEKEFGVDYVVGVDQYLQLPELLNKDGGSEIEFDHFQIYPGLKPVHSDNTCAFVTIMRGCDNFCSYCIVPHVRGRERSVALDEIIDEVAKCGDNGLKDVTLLGQNVNSYRWNDYDFPKLLRELNKIDSIYRLRFVTSHPKDLSDDLVAAMADCDKVCEHIHLPLQSGSDMVLRAMNRKYTFGHYLDLTKKLRQAMPDISLTTDLIAGFPGETRLDFEMTLEAMREIQFDYAFCFKYSEREGTAACSFENKVPEAERLARLQEMIELQRKITLEKFSAQIGSEVEIYVESLSKKSSRQISGKTRDYKIAVMDGDESDIGTLKKARVKSATAGTLICK